MLPSTIDELSASAQSNNDWFRNYMWGNLPRISADANFIHSIVPKEHSILDVGAVPPLLLKLLYDKGYRDLHTCDPHVETFNDFFKAANISYHNVDIIKEPEEMPKRKYGCVVLCEVIEHLGGNLLTALKTVADVVDNEGFFYVTTPNLRSISGLFSLFRYQSGLASKPRESVRQQFERAGSECGYFGHIREYTPKEVIVLVESLGFKLVKKEMQTRYYGHTRCDNIGVRLENLFPNWRLFAKFLFKKI
jgi:hypothetical protein